MGNSAWAACSPEESTSNRDQMGQVPILMSFNCVATLIGVEGTIWVKYPFSNEDITSFYKRLGKRAINDTTQHTIKFDQKIKIGRED